MLHGRAAELAYIHGLIAEARAGKSSAVVIEGEAGSGKTTLLEHVVAAAGGMRVLSCTGVESEAELPFAALHLLLRDCLARIDALPDPQAAALRAAFGLAQVPGIDRFLAGLATLTLLSEVAAAAPLIVVVDDAQWLDRASLDALAFVGRRLGAEGLVLLIAVRDEVPADLRGFPMLPLTSLSASDAEALLAERAADLAPSLRDRLIEEADGNPLALIELAGALRGSGSFVGPTALAAGRSSAGRRVLDAFGAQVDALPMATRQALLVAAAEDTGDLGIVLAAAERKGLDFNDFAPAEHVGLVRVSNESVTFRHPLIRSAVYGRAPVRDRAEVHRALADSMPAPECADRRAWHLAAAAIGYDDAAAEAMEAAALRADLRGGYAASAAAHERSARLTADPMLRGQRLAAAAHSARDCAQLERAETLAREAAQLTSDPATLARLSRVRARMEFERSTARRASEIMLEGASIVYDHDREQAAGLLIESVRIAYFADEAPRLAEAITMIETLRLPDGHPLQPMLAATAIVAKQQAGWPEERVPPLSRVVDAIHAGELGATVGNLPGHIAFLRLVIGEADEALAQAWRMLAESRERGMIGGLPHILLTLAQAALAAGRLQEALRAASDGVRIAEETGQPHSAANMRAVLARVTALTGDESRCREFAEEAIRVGTQRHSSTVGLAVLALAVLDLGYGRYGSALEQLESLPAQLRCHPSVAHLAAPEWVEAAARSGHPERAAEMLAFYEPWVAHHRDPVGQASLHRCRALLADDDEAEAHYRMSLSLHRDTNRPMALARTELLYGEWLRRMRRRSDAREPLRAALAVFESVGARSWAERARAELRATGESVATASERADGQLTPQELQVVRLAAAGLSNRDIGAQLFISPRTVGYHLYKAFPKLGVADRHELAGLDLS